MIEYIKLLAEIDFASIIFAVVVIAFVVVGGKELIEKFCKTVGLEFSWIRKSRELDEYRAKIRKDLDDLQKRQKDFEEEHKENIAAREVFNKEMIDSLEDIRKDVRTLAEELDRGRAEDRFKKLKYYIVSSANRIVRKEVVSEELIKGIYADINEYNELHMKYGFENDQVPASVAVITEKYKEMLKAGHVTHEED